MRNEVEKLENFDLVVIRAAKVRGGSLKGLARLIFPHPTVSEHIGDAARSEFGKAIPA